MYAVTFFGQSLRVRKDVLLPPTKLLPPTTSREKGNANVTTVETVETTTVVGSPRRS